MKILIVRHAIAESREGLEGKGAELAQQDAARALTPKGKKRMRETAKGLKALVPKIGLLATSPLKRAAQTAKILAKVYKAKPVEVKPLSPGARQEELLGWLAKRKEEMVALVGHEPDLSAFAGKLLVGRESSFMDLRKGGACLIAFDGKPAAGKGVLVWHLKPALLRRLA